MSGTAEGTVFGDAIDAFRNARARTSTADALLIQAASRAKEILIESANVESRVAALRQVAAVNVTMSGDAVLERKQEVDQHRRDELAATIAVQTVATAHAAGLRDSLLQEALKEAAEEDPQPVAEAPQPDPDDSAE